MAEQGENDAEISRLLCYRARVHVPRSTVPTAGTDCFLCFPTTNPIYFVDFRSAPLNSDDFLTTGFRPGFRRKNSGKFRKISTGIRWKLTKPIGTDRNLSDEIRTGIL